MTSTLQRFLRRAFTLAALLPVLAAQAQNNASFVAQVVPTSMNAGQPYTVSVTMKNTGATTWQPATHKLASQNPADNLTWSANRVALAAAVAPGQQYTFSATVPAPARGTYNFQWQMGQEGVEYFGPLTPNVVVNVGTGNNAAYVSQSVPATMVAGQSYPVTVTMKNTGVSSWTSASGIQLASQNPSDNLTWGANRVGVAGTVAPGQTYSFTANVPAPAAPGTYNFQWQMGQQSVEYFGPLTPNVAVVVNPAPPTVTVTRTPAPMVAGRTTTLNWSTTGATSLTRACTAAGTGYKVPSTAFALSGSSSATADAAWVGNPSTCTWTGTGAGGTKTLTETMTTVLPPAPVVSVTRTPAPMLSGQSYTMSWSATDATSMKRVCTSTGTGYTDNSTLGVSGNEAGTASTSWVGYPSTCTWTATGLGGSGSKVETLTTSQGPATTYFHNDISGTPIVATDAQGAVVWKETYQPYGAKINNGAAEINNKLWFAGKPYDANSGLSYMGARYYDPVVGRFVGIDPKGVDPQDIHSFNRYAYGNNNPYKFVDLDGKASVLAVPLLSAIAVGGIYATSSPAQRQQMIDSANRLARKVDEVVDRLRGIVLSDSTDGVTKGGADAPPSLPTGIVGEQSDPRAGPNKSGGKWTSGPLAPENGGTGDFGKDLDHLTGGTRPSQPGDRAPPGSHVGPNGIFGRPTNSSGGSSIDIPATGTKPHETLHYP